jgi:hypothetical protein
MNISVADFMTLQACSLDRRRHQQQLMSHRRERSVSLGPCMRLQFEDELTLRHQIQQILKAERITGAEGIRQEIETYSHLLPSGMNWKATLLIEIPDALERERELPQLNRAAHELYVEVARQPRVVAQANEDLVDRHLSRPSAVHFLRFELPAPLRSAVLAGATVTLGCAHPQYAYRRVMAPALIARLRRDLVQATHLADAVAAETSTV